jgi:hypothetical protein
MKGRIMMNAVGMGSGAMMHVPSLIEIGSGMHKLVREDSHTDSIEIA